MLIISGRAAAALVYADGRGCVRANGGHAGAGGREALRAMP